MNYASAKLCLLQKARPQAYFLENVVVDQIQQTPLYKLDMKFCSFLDSKHPRPTIVVKI